MRKNNKMIQRWTGFLALTVLAVVPAAFAIDPPKVSGLLQAWTVNDTTATATLNFLLRRAELKFSGNLTDGVRYFMMVDAAKSTSLTDKILQDLGVGIKLMDGLELVAGQFKTQTTAEGLDSSAELWFPERSLQARTFGDIRQPGLLLKFDQDAFKIGLMVSNGATPNVSDTNAKKDVTARIDWKAHDLVKVGAFTRAANYALDPTNGFGFNTRVKPIDKFELRADLAFAKASAVKTTGYTIDFGYQWDEKCMPVLRYDSFKANNVANATRAYIIGLNHNLGATNSKVEVAYGITDNVNAPASADGKYVAGTQSGSIFTLAFQAAF